MDCNFLLTHPKLPILFVFTDDGRVICIAIQIKLLPPISTDEEEFRSVPDIDFLATPYSSGS